MSYGCLYQSEGLGELYFSYIALGSTHVVMMSNRTHESVTVLGGICAWVGWPQHHNVFLRWHIRVREIVVSLKLLEKSDWKLERMGMWIYSGIYRTNNNIPKYKIICDWKHLNKNTLALLIITLAKNSPQVEHRVVTARAFEFFMALWVYVI